MIKLVIILKMIKKFKKIYEIKSYILLNIICDYNRNKYENIFKWDLIVIFILENNPKMKERTIKLTSHLL